jgi:ABC-type oligopeptide transport system substrate-binding subunit
MRSFRTLRIATLAASLIAVPFAGAYAAGYHKGALDEATPTVFSGPRVTGLIDQVQGVAKGIADARQENTITSAEAQRLHMRAARISRAAERVVTADHGRIPGAQYRQLLRRLDNVDQALLLDTGNAFKIGDYSDGANPNG